MSTMRLMWIKNLLDNNSELAHNEVLLWARFLKQFWYCPKIDLKDACIKYKNLEELMSAYNKKYDIILIRDMMNKYL